MFIPNLLYLSPPWHFVVTFVAPSSLSEAIIYKRFHLARQQTIILYLIKIARTNTLTDEISFWEFELELASHKPLCHNAVVGIIDDDDDACLFIIYLPLAGRLIFSFVTHNVSTLTIAFFSSLFSRLARRPAGSSTFTETDHRSLTHYCWNLISHEINTVSVIKSH